MNKQESKHNAVLNENSLFHLRSPKHFLRRKVITFFL